MSRYDTSDIAIRIKANCEVAQPAAPLPISCHDHRLARRRGDYFGVRAVRVGWCDLRPHRRVAMAADDHLNAIHLLRQLAVEGDADMRQCDDLVDALRL